MKESDLLNLRKIDCDLEGHPTPVSQESGDLSWCWIFPWRREYDVQVILCLVKLFFHFHFHQKLEFVDVATGSLGQGLGPACGMAYTGKNFDKSRLVCLESM